MTDPWRRRVTALVISMAVTLSIPVNAMALSEDSDGTGNQEPTLFTSERMSGEQEVFKDKLPAEKNDDAQSTAQTVNTAASGGSLAELVNSAQLNRVDPSSPQLSAYVDDIMAGIITEEMDTYSKLSACYDYMMSTVTYGSHLSKLGTTIGDTTCRQIYNAYGEVEGFGAVALSARVGMCNAYASGFILMARKLGLHAYLVKGSTKRAGGGYTYHEWAEINIDGQVYLFDPQLDQDLYKAGLPYHSVFFKTYEQVPNRYSK